MILIRRWMIVSIVCFSQSALASFNDPNADRNSLPSVPAGFEISFFAREPLVRQPCSLAFDSKGRLCVGMGPQYRNPKPDTPGDSVVLVLDDDGDGKADRTHVFATGFNAIQGLAWRGKDLWVANAPDLTVVRDLNGDDTADEYVRIYGDLGNLEHGLHGLNWAPDGKLYMSKGNSKGLTQPDRIAPKPFRDLWGVVAPPEFPDFPQPQTFNQQTYKKQYHDPSDDWGKEGGILRCDPGGRNLEIVSRGMRNPWDIAFDSGFEWLGTDNDQTLGDRVFVSFFGAHFGWNHPWSSNWGPTTPPPTAPVSGPLFEGSGTGVVFSDSKQFPDSHRGVFFVNDWLSKSTFIWRPDTTADRPLMQPAPGTWETFVTGGKSLFRPTDLEFGPDGALYILGWSAGYGAEYDDKGDMSSEGRVFRIRAVNNREINWRKSKRERSIKSWTTTELVEEFESAIPTWKTESQIELIDRGDSIISVLKDRVTQPAIDKQTETWLAWTLAQISPDDAELTEWFSKRTLDATTSLNLRVQSLRIIESRTRNSPAYPSLINLLAKCLDDPSSKIRFEAVQALYRSKILDLIPYLLNRLATETDPTIFYAGWQALRKTTPKEVIKKNLADPRSGVKKAAMLALMEDHALKTSEVRSLGDDPDPSIKQLAALWLTKATAGTQEAVIRGRPLEVHSTSNSSVSSLPRIDIAQNIRARSGLFYNLVPGGLVSGVRPYTDRSFTLKNVPTELQGVDFIQTANEDDGSKGKSFLTFNLLLPSRVRIAMDTRIRNIPSWIANGFQKDAFQIQADHWIFQTYSRTFEAGQVSVGGNTEDGVTGGKGNYVLLIEPLPVHAPSSPTSIATVLSTMQSSNVERGRWLFHAEKGVGCFNCHQLEGHGNTFGPDLSTLGFRAEFNHIIQSILEPNQVITEGFHQMLVTTKNSEFAGILLEESDLSLSLGLATGKRITIPKSDISNRKREALSAMPAYNLILNPIQTADLTAYLLSFKTGSNPPQPKASAESASPSPIKQKTQPENEVSPETNAGPDHRSGFRFNLETEKLVIHFATNRVAEFVFRDRQILRPYFSNFRTPIGNVATRSHPPVPGLDATDHADMHPGIWLAFGEISGTDFWRNKGKLEHQQFSIAPSVKDQSLSFDQVCDLKSSKGETMGWVTNSITLSYQTNAWLLHWDAKFYSDSQDLTFGDQEEMGFAARVASSITQKNGGAIISSTGLTTAQSTWGQQADWCDYSGGIKQERFGIALFADPTNFRRAWWHNRDYGVFVANPFGREAMKQGQRSAIAIPKGQIFQIRFAAAIHDAGSFNPTSMFHYLQRTAWSKR